MNSAPSTSNATTAQRKRGGRTSKTANTKQTNSEEPAVVEGANFSENTVKTMNRMDSKNILEADGAALAISPPAAKATTEVAAVQTASGECRRSSRKKIIKFDVRDLLNKHRKPHKIQIEARIDSNAPQTQKPTTSSASMGGGGNVAGNSGTASATSDLSSKQKAFMEKSAIFRRMSISEQQNKIIAPPLPPPLSQIPKIDPAKIAQARRLSRTQEIFNASLMKSKQNSSLIVAQIESNNSSSSSGLISQTIATSQPIHKKPTTATNKRKSVSNTCPSPTSVADTKNVTPEFGGQKRRGRSVKSKITAALSTTTKINQNPKAESKDLDEQQNLIAVEDPTNMTATKATSNTATNWKEYKANLAKTNESLESNVQKRLLTKKNKTQSEDIILEISSTSSISEHEFQPAPINTTKDKNESPQRNFASVCIWQESSNICEAVTPTEFFVAAVEEITTEPNAEISKPLNVEIESNTSTQEIVTQPIESTKDDAAAATASPVMELSKVANTEMDPSSPVTPRGPLGSRKSSGSESESGSDRSNKSYKKGDKLRVSLKRMTLPERVNTSTITLSSASSNSSDVIVGDSNSRSSPTSSCNINNINYIGDNNGNSNETSTVAANKVLPTRRSHRLPLKNAAEKSTGHQSQTKIKTILNESFNKIEHKMALKEVEKIDNTLPVDLNVLDTAVKMDTNELSKKEEVVDEKTKNLKSPTNEDVNEASEILMAVSPHVEDAESSKKQIQDTIVDLPEKIENKATQETSQNSPLELFTVNADEADNKDDPKSNKEAATCSSIQTLSDVNSDASYESKKERITLPLKKQVSKFKMYEAAVQDVAANVETSTLLDILNTVKQNDLTTSTATNLESSNELVDQSVHEQLQTEIIAGEGEMQGKRFENETVEMSVGISSNTTFVKASDQPTEVNIEVVHSYDGDSPSKIIEDLPTVQHEHESKTDDVQAMTDVALEIEIEFEDESSTVKHFNEAMLNMGGQSVATTEDKISKIIAEAESQNILEALPLEETIATATTTTKSATEKYQETRESSASTSKANSAATTTPLANVSLEYPLSPPPAESPPANLEEQSMSSDLSSDKTYDESSSEGISPKQRKVGAKKTPSPTPSSGYATKKPTRRYERRSQRGNVSAHKTLEETFAEIAAESSKAVLELRAKQVEMPIERSEEVLNENVHENVELAANIVESKNIAAKSDVTNASAETLNKSSNELSSLTQKTTENKDSGELYTVKADKGKQIGECVTVKESESEKIAVVAKVTKDEMASTAERTGAEETLTKMDDNLLNVVIIAQDGDSNSNHTPPTRRGRKAKNKKSPTASPTNETVSQNEKTIETEIEAKVIDNEIVAATPEASTAIIKTAEQQDLQASREFAGLEEAAKIDNNIISDHDKQASEATQIVEQTEITIMSKADDECNFVPVTLSDQQTEIKSYGVENTVQLKEMETSEIQQRTTRTTPTIHSPSIIECDMTIAAKKAQNESLSPTPVKSRKQKRGTSSKLQKSANTDLDANKNTKQNEAVEALKQDIDGAQLQHSVNTETEANINEMHKMSDQVAVFTPERHSSSPKIEQIANTMFESKRNERYKTSETVEQDKPAVPSEQAQSTISESLESLKNTKDNVFENMEKMFESVAASKKDDSLTDAKISVGEIATTNVTDQLLEQERAKTTTPIDKSKKVKKRKSTKATNDEKLTMEKSLSQSESTSPPPADGAKIVEKIEKSAEKEDTSGKVRKPRKGKNSPETINDNVSLAAAENETVANSPLTAEAVIEKDVLAKAPPKKRLLKMQLQFEEKSTGNDTNIELPTTSAKSSGSTASNANKSKEKKTKKEAKISDELTAKRTSFDNQTESSSLDEESRSANSTPVAKRFKQQKAVEKTPEDKTKSGAKRKSKWDQPPSSNAEKIDNAKNIEILKDKDNKSAASSSSPTKKTEKKKCLSNEDNTTHELAKKMEEKSAKKKRQKKLKEAFEAALNDALNKQQIQIESNKESVTVTETSAATKVELEEKMEELTNTAITTTITTTVTTGTVTTEDKPITTEESNINKVPESAAMIEPEEDPDPLKDIEKFIEDGVNLLKRGYKIDDDSVDEVICSKTLLQKDEYKNEKEECIKKGEEVVNTTLRDGMITPNESIIDAGTGTDIISAEKTFEDSTAELTQNLYYETPADTPVATPTTTPPPKSPTNDSSIEEISGVRRSHRIKLITKTPKALVGRGLVREKERFSIKDDVEMKTHYSLDDHLTDLAQVEAKNAKFLKEMEERLSNFQVIKDNEYKCERVVSREARKMLCDCFLTAEEEERGELGCGEDCLNRLLMIECGPDCNVKERCTNKRFQKVLCSPCRVFRTEKKGFGIMADIEILPGEFIMEYVGEVINGDEFEQRRTAYSLDKNRHYYFMALRSDAIIDATIKGNISRFINHSCDPNAETQKWTVNGELRIGFFSRKSIMPGEEITFDYQYQRYGREAQRCYCESANCRGWIGEEPNSDEGEQIDEDSDALADVSDEDESDDSIADAEEAQKKLGIEASGAGKITTHADEDGKGKLDEKIDSTLKDKQKKKEDADDDAKAKFKKLAGKSTDKASRKKNKIKEKKAKRLRTSATGESSKNARYLEDPDIEDEVKFLSRGGLRNQSDTLRFSRLVVRAKLSQTRLNLLKILRNAELPCRRLFLDYHGLRLLHGWMTEDGGDMAIRLALLEALESLPIANKTVLTDSKVYQSVRNWCGNALPSHAVPPTSGSASSPSDESSKESTSSNSMQQDAGLGVGMGAQEVPSELQKLALKLTTTWNSLPEIFRIPKRERIEQMKEHEREADRQYAEASVDTNRSSYTSDRYQRDRFGRGPTNSRYSKPSFSKDNRSSNITVVGSTANNDPRRRSAQDNNSGNNESMKHLSKEQRREMFAAKVARDEAEKRMAEERREFETKCRFFGLDPKKTRPQDVPFCVDPSTGQWFSVARQPIPTPPCYAHIQVHPKPKSIDPADYKLPAVVATLPPQWKFAITTLGQIYYYHHKQRIPQWHPPTPEQLRAAAEEADSTDSESCEEAKMINESSEEDEVLIGMDEAKLKAFIDKKIEHRRNKRYNRLVDERPISPRKEEDRIYNQIEMRKYKENKEKIRKRKEDIRRKRVEALKSVVAGVINPNGNVENLNTDAILTKIKTEIDSDEPDDAIPIQDYLLSSDEEEIMKAECNNSPLLDKIVQGDKIVDELDALTTKRALKRPLPPHRDLSAVSVSSSIGSSSTSSGAAGGGGGASEHKRRKSDKKEKSKKSKDSDSKYRRNKEKFRCEIAGIIVQHLKPYRKESCALGRIQSDEDFNHLARKLTHFVMVKELKYCEAVGQTLIVTESVKNKSREFIKKYMAKYGGSYVKPLNDPEFKDIPFTI